MIKSNGLQIPLLNEYESDSDNTIFSAKGTSIYLYSDNEDIIKTCNERLMYHFPYNKNDKIDKIIKLYALHSAHSRQFVESLNLQDSKHSWRQIRHMGGYYYNTKVQGKLGVTVWVTNNHTCFGDQTFPISQLLMDYFKEKDNICLLISELENNYVYFYNNNYDLKIMPYVLYFWHTMCNYYPNEEIAEKYKPPH